MPKFGNLGSKLSKAIDKFEISKFKKGCMRNFVKIRESTNTFWPKMPKFGHLSLKFEKEKLVGNSRFPQF